MVARSTARVTWSLLACAFAALMGQGAHGAETGVRRAVVIDISEGSASQAKVAREVERALASDPSFVLQDLHATLNAGGERDDATNIKSAQAFRTAGLAALATGQTEDAAEQLQTAAGLMSRSFALLRDADEYRELLVELATVQLRSGDKGSARATFVDAAVFGAERASIELSADEQAMLVAARDELKAAPRGAVQINSTPAAAEAWVDGRFVGVTPVAAAGLTAGPHIVTLFKAGYAPVTTTATANAEALEQVSAELAPARRKLLYDAMVAQLRQEVDAVGAPGSEGGDGVQQAGSLMLSEVAMVVRSSGPPSDTLVELYFFDTQSRRLLRKETGTVDPTSRGLRDAVAPLVAKVSDIQWAVALGGEADDPDKRKKSTRLVKKWWFWTIIGVGVAGAATAAVLLATRDSGTTTPPTTGSVVVSF